MDSPFIALPVIGRRSIGFPVQIASLVKSAIEIQIEMAPFKRTFRSSTGGSGKSCSRHRNVKRIDELVVSVPGMPIRVLRFYKPNLFGMVRH